MGWPFQLFGRRGGKPPRDARAEGGVWRVGELAVCITNTWFDVDGRPAGLGPQNGDLLLVASVSETEAGGALRTMLGFQGRWASYHWSAAGFRKPVADETGADAKIAARIKRSRRAPAPESVEP